MTKRMAEIISRHSGQDVDQVLRDIDRDRFMTPEEAADYGLIDAIMTPGERPDRAWPADPGPVQCSESRAGQ